MPKPHSILREGTAYEGDQPVTYEIACSCGEVFDHIAPQNALNQWHNHVRESLEEQLEALRMSLQLIKATADGGEDYDSIALSKIEQYAKNALDWNPAKTPLPGDPIPESWKGVGGIEVEEASNQESKP